MSPRLVLNIDGTITVAGTFRTIRISEIGEIGFGQSHTFQGS